MLTTRPPEHFCAATTPDYKKTSSLILMHVYHDTMRFKSVYQTRSSIRSLFHVSFVIRSFMPRSPIGLIYSSSSFVRVFYSVRPSVRRPSVRRPSVRPFSFVRPTRRLGLLCIIPLLRNFKAPGNMTCLMSLFLFFL